MNIVISLRNYVTIAGEKEFIFTKLLYEMAIHFSLQLVSVKASVFQWLLPRKFYNKLWNRT
jgi:hypothetical protein